MKISIINGSQKTGESNSELILERLSSYIDQKHEINRTWKSIKNNL